ncbi:hypothetical protein ACA910_007531 [Epithemia clementina (nom. ined.)]
MTVIQHQLDGINEDLLQGMLAAECKCGSRYQNPWSPALMKARLWVRFWKSHMTKLRTGKDLSTQRVCLLNCLNHQEAIVYPPIPTRGYYHKQLKLARNVVRTCLQNAQALCFQHLMDRAAHYAFCQDRAKETILNNMIRIEQQRTMFSTFRVLLGKTTKNEGLFGKSQSTRDRHNH